MIRYQLGLRHEYFFFFEYGHRRGQGSFRTEWYNMSDYFENILIYVRIILHNAHE